MGMILRIASSRIVGQGDIVGRSGYFSLNLSANSVMRGRLDARRTLKSLVADLRSIFSMNLHGRILNRIKSYQKLLLNYISIKIFLPNIQAKTIVCRYFLQESELELHVTIHTFHYSKNKRNNTNISHVNSIPLKDVGFLGIMSNNY